DLRRVRVARALALPEVEDAGRLPVLLGRLAPVAGRERAVLLPGSPVDGQAAVTVARDPEEAHRRRFFLGSHRQRELPPEPFDERPPPFRLDRLAELLV